VVGCWRGYLSERGADLHTAQLMPLPLIVSCFSKIQIGFTFLVPEKGPLNGCVCGNVLSIYSDLKLAVGAAVTDQKLGVGVSQKVVERQPVATQHVFRPRPLIAAARRRDFAGVPTAQQS